MTLLLQIKEDQLQFRRDRNRLETDLLTTLIGDAEMVGKNDGSRTSTDSEVLAVVRKFLKNVNETIRLAPINMLDRLEIEKDILEQYVPQQLTLVELQAAVVSVISQLGADSIKQMGLVMKELKNQYDGQYDGRVASNLVKEQLT